VALTTGRRRLQVTSTRADLQSMETVQRQDVPCDREHLDTLRAPDSDVAVPSNPAALESIARLLAHQRTPTA
jgi:hypothetical protein